LLFQSNGGLVGDGICLHNFFRALPIELTLYNVGSIASIAVTAYLGAKHRKASAYAAFMLHRTYASPQAATSDRLHAIAQSVSLDDERTEAILRRIPHLGRGPVERSQDCGPLVLSQGRREMRNG
jgi:ATP-dependent Clp protease protease subunit